jgi:hypothetical protein
MFSIAATRGLNPASLRTSAEAVATSSDCDEDLIPTEIANQVRHSAATRVNQRLKTFLKLGRFCFSIIFPPLPATWRKQPKNPWWMNLET